jgi:serpin B
LLGQRKHNHLNHRPGTWLAHRVRMLRFTWSLLVLLTLNACTADLRDIAPPGDARASTAQRITQAAPTADVQEASRSNTALALRLLARNPDGNLIFSPYSITVATSMVAAGANGSTLTGITTALQQTLPGPRHHRALNTLDAAVSTRGASARGTAGRPFRLVVTNQLFADRSLSFEAPFLDTLAQEYGSGLRLLDFARNAAEAPINQWVSQRTEGKIPQLFQPGALEGSVAAIVNTVYFNAAWDEAFPQANTRTAPFTRLDGQRASVSMMRSGPLQGARAALIDEVQVLELPYDGKEVSLLVLAPQAGSFTSFAQQLTASRLETLMERLVAGSFDVQLPKFRTTSSLDLKADLQALGMSEAFDQGLADFSPMTGNRDLFIRRAVHQAIIELDENGTEAAAATGFGFGRVSLPIVEEIVIDRPFLFFIRDAATGVVLFAGRVVNPT